MLSKIEIIQNKIYQIEDLKRIRNQWRMLSKKVVFTNGCFDLVHRGHNTFLLQAADYGNRLIVAINSDTSVKRLKGESRPIVDEQSRAFNLACHTYIDAVIVFEEDTPEHLLHALNPDVLVKGGDYTLDTIVGADYVKSYGGTVEIIPILDGYSTTGIVNKIGG
jgi:D-glycero-beta-D-manno-heptose 1-phosphate adenylyltransferase